MSENFANTGLFLQLGLLSTPIHSKNWAFWKCYYNLRNLKMSAFHFCVGEQAFWKQNFSKTMSISKFLCLRVDENIWRVFRVKHLFSNPSGIMWMEPKTTFRARVKVSSIPSCISFQMTFENLEVNQDNNLLNIVMTSVILVTCRVENVLIL